MRFLLFPLAAVFAFAPNVRADDAADAKAIVEKAIKARGDKPNDTRTALTWTDKGTYSLGAVKMMYTADWAFQGPDKYRFTMTGAFGGEKFTMTVVANGDSAWAAEGGKTEALAGEKLEYTRNEVYQMWVTMLTPLVNDKGFTLATVPAKDVSGKPAVGVKVTRDKRPPMTLYFDKASGLLVKTEMTVKDEAQKWKEVLDEVYFEDYKEKNGTKFFHTLRIVRDGKPMITATLSDQKVLDKLDAKTFDKPK